jgi:hypothetical protein
MLFPEGCMVAPGIGAWRKPNGGYIGENAPEEAAC